MELASPQFWVSAIEIVVINILLSGDNAVVIALACRNLPPKQRRWGVIWGAAGAVVLRIILTFFAAQLLAFPYLNLIGGALLIWIGVKLIVEEDDDGSQQVKAADRMLVAIRIVIVADLVMSLDNVIGVAGAAKGSVVLIVFGLVVSIPLVVIGAQIIMKLIERFPILIVAGGALLGYVAGEMMVVDTAVAPWIAERAAWMHWVLPVAGIVVVVAVAKWVQVRALR